jgi:serine/threonine protein kinase
MYPPELEDSPIKLSPKYHLLVLNWSLQLLSALRFIHSHNIIYGGINPSACFLSSTLSVSLVGFLDAEFVDEYGYGAYRPDGDISVKDELCSWAKFLYFRMMKYNGGTGYWPILHDDPQPARIPNDMIGREVLRKCSVGEYENAADVWTDFEAALNERGYVLDGDSLKDFDPVEMLAVTDQKSAS